MTEPFVFNGNASERLNAYTEYLLAGDVITAEQALDYFNETAVLKADKQWVYDGFNNCWLKVGSLKLTDILQRRVDEARALVIGYNRLLLEVRKHAKNANLELEKALEAQSRGTLNGVAP